MDGEIVREEAELGDYKRKCTKDWMGFQFGGLVECCEKGVIVGDIGRQIIQSIPEDVTQPGLPRAYYSAHGRVGDLVVEAQRAVSQVIFSGNPPGHLPTSAPTSRPQAPTSQELPVQSPFLPTPSLGSNLTLGVPMYNPPPGPPPGPPPPIRRASVDELGVHAPSAHYAPQFSSLPTNKERERDPVPMSSSVGPSMPLSFSTPYDSGVARTEESQSLMASIADALSQSHRGFTLEDATSLGHVAPDEPVPKYELHAGDVGRPPRSEPHGPVTNGHASSPPRTEEREGTRRATRRSTSPPCLPPGAAPAAIRAWDDRMGQGEDGAHSDRPASSSADVPSQRLTSSSERDGEEEDGLAYDRDDLSSREGGSGGEASVEVITTTSEEQSTTSIRRSVSTGAVSNLGGTTSLARAGSQWRIPRVPPPSVEADAIDINQPSTHERQSLHGIGPGAQEDDESADERARDAAAAREVSREMDALTFSATAPRSPSGYETPRAPPPGYGATQSQAAAPYPRSSSPPQPASGRTPQNSVPPSPILPPNPPFANQGRGGAMIEMRYPGHASSESISGHIPVPPPTIVTSVMDGGGAASPTSPKHRSPPPEYPRPTPPFSSPLMASSTSSLNNPGSGGGPRTISAAAFRRQADAVSEWGCNGDRARGYESVDVEEAVWIALAFVFDTTAATDGIGIGSASLVPVSVNKDLPRARLSVVNPDPRVSDEEEGGEDQFDYIGAYGGDGAGYAAGRYVSDLERH
ncbi:hypothetical protein JVT61DRAFT_9842 [Boletus reticuloceps]|uniref:Uncharacterized protein n=1 Tax=Boletus reticuloceps TaxID=495285 RepID=A0A8I2YGV2_9AGAM|nr:hypothetical protein JVT61DRAFT_9842 [Boletus reticuloceps]